MKRKKKQSKTNIMQRLHEDKVNIKGIEIKWYNFINENDPNEEKQKDGKCKQGTILLLV